MNYLDIVLGAFLLFGLIRGFMKGLVIEVASLIAFIAGLYCAIHFAFYAADFLKGSVSWEESTINLVAFAITFICVALLIYLLGRILTKAAEAVALGLTNRFLGAVFGFLKIGLILSALLIFFQSTNNLIKFVDQKVLDESILYEPITATGKLIFQSFIESEIKPEDLEQLPVNTGSETP